MFNKILIVCIGNICRSPMAETIFKHRIKKLNLNADVSSAGLGALVGKGADSNVQEILKKNDMDCSDHRARQITSAMLKDAELVLVMEHFHRKEIEYMLPAVCGKVHLLGKWGNFEIPDPYKQKKEIFEKVYHLVDQGIDQWQQKLWN